MKTFYLLRVEDESGVSGNGIVAEGIEFSDGTVVVKWVIQPYSMNINKSMEDLINVHGHGGRTKIVTSRGRNSN